MAWKATSPWLGRHMTAAPVLVIDIERVVAD
jgi:hypothetical protein